MIYKFQVRCLDPRENDDRIWMNISDAEDVLKNHPNPDYTTFFQAARREPGLRCLISPFISDEDNRSKTENCGKRVILMCIDYANRMLFVKNAGGLYALPGHTWRTLPMQNKRGKKLAKMLMAHYGTVGAIHKVISETRSNDNDTPTVTVIYHVLSFKQNEKGVSFHNPYLGTSACQSNIICNIYDRLWLSPEETKRILTKQGIEYVSIYNERSASSPLWKNKMVALAAKKNRVKWCIGENYYKNYADSDDDE